MEDRIGERWQKQQSKDQKSQTVLPNHRLYANRARFYRAADPLQWVRGNILYGGPCQSNFGDNHAHCALSHQKLEQDGRGFRLEWRHPLHSPLDLLCLAGFHWWNRHHCHHLLNVLGFPRFIRRNLSNALLLKLVRNLLPFVLDHLEAEQLGEGIRWNYKGGIRWGFKGIYYCSEQCLIGKK